MRVGSIPQCWSGMAETLEQFYCTNCMMTEPPYALRGFAALKSFVAFRQHESIPSVAAKRGGRCKASWETRAQLKDRRPSSGGFGDFQHLEAGSFRLLGRGRALAQRNGDFLDAGILQVERMGVALAAVADDGDLLALDQVQVGVAIVINTHGRFLVQGRKSADGQCPKGEICGFRGLSRAFSALRETRFCMEIRDIMHP